MMIHNRRVRDLIRIALGLPVIGLAAWGIFRLFYPAEIHFDGQEAYNHVITQVAFGPRIPGSYAHTRAVSWMQDQLSQEGWQVEIQVLESMGHPIQNVIARRSEVKPQILLGAHYDSRLVADLDPGAGRLNPVPGANDGASGVAVLLELARTLPINTVPVWLVFFDAEDNAGLPGWDGELGSRAFVASLTEKPQAAIIVDMIGDADLNIHIERNSNPDLAASLWAKASALGYGGQFLDQPKYGMIDDHTPFLDAGIPAMVVIDFDYPYWHTSADTTDKVSAESLQIVGETLRQWIISTPEHP